jgi:hypothetical protein
MKRGITYDSTHRRSLKQSNPQKQEVEWRVPGDGGRANGEMLFNG